MEEIIKFLSRHNSLISFLLEVFKQIDKYFPNAPLEFFIFDNFETNEKKLRIEIIVNTTPEEAHKKLNEFRYGWWLEHLEELLCIDINWRD